MPEFIISGSAYYRFYVEANDSAEAWDAFKDAIDLSDIELDINDAETEMVE